MIFCLLPLDPGHAQPISPPLISNATNEQTLLPVPVSPDNSMDAKLPIDATRTLHNNLIFERGEE